MGKGKSTLDALLMSVWRALRLVSNHQDMSHSYDVHRPLLDILFISQSADLGYPISIPSLAMPFVYRLLVLR